MRRRKNLVTGNRFLKNLRAIPSICRAHEAGNVKQKRYKHRDLHECSFTENTELWRNVPLDIHIKKNSISLQLYHYGLPPCTDRTHEDFSNMAKDKEN